MKAIYQGERIAEIPEVHGFSSRNVFLSSDLSKLKVGDEIELEIKNVGGHIVYTVKTDEKGQNDLNTGNATPSESTTQSTEPTA